MVCGADSEGQTRCHRYSVAQVLSLPAGDCQIFWLDIWRTEPAVWINFQLFSGPIFLGLASNLGLGFFYSQSVSQSVSQSLLGANYLAPGWFKFCLRRKLPAPGTKGGLFLNCVESMNLT